MDRDTLRRAALQTYRTNRVLGLVGVLQLGLALLAVMFVVNVVVLMIALPFGWYGVLRPPWLALFGIDAAFVGILFFEHRRGHATRFEDIGRGDLDTIPAVAAVISLAMRTPTVGAPNPSAAAYVFFGLPRLFWATVDRFRKSRPAPSKALEAALALAELLHAQPNGRREIDTIVKGGGEVHLRDGLLVLVDDLRWAYVADGPKGPRLVATDRLMGI